MILAVSEGSPICIVLCGGSWCTVWPWHATASSVCSSSGPATCTTAVAVMQRLIQCAAVRLRYERWVRLRYNTVDAERSDTRVLGSHSAHVAGIGLPLSHSTLWMEKQTREGQRHTHTQPHMHRTCFSKSTSAAVLNAFRTNRTHGCKSVTHWMITRCRCRCRCRCKCAGADGANIS